MPGDIAADEAGFGFRGGVETLRIRHDDDLRFQRSDRSERAADQLPVIDVGSMRAMSKLTDP